MPERESLVMWLRIQQDSCSRDVARQLAGWRLYPYRGAWSLRSEGVNHKVGVGVRANP